MTVKIPRTVKVGPYSYTIATSELALRRAESSQRSPLLGHCSSGNLEIVVAADNPLRVQQATLIHELLHAMVDLAGLDFDAEEQVVTALAPIVLDVLRRNKALVTYLLA